LPAVFSFPISGPVLLGCELMMRTGV